MRHSRNEEVGGVAQAHEPARGGQPSWQISVSNRPQAAIQTQIGELVSWRSGELEIRQLANSPILQLFAD
jgi:hypothetical protein